MASSPVAHQTCMSHTEAADRSKPSPWEGDIIPATHRVVIHPRDAVLPSLCTGWTCQRATLSHDASLLPISARCVTQIQTQSFSCHLLYPQPTPRPSTAHLSVSGREVKSLAARPPACMATLPFPGTTRPSCKRIFENKQGLE